MSLKLVIFDLDGTLVDTSEDITNALNYAVAPYGLKTLAVKDTIGMVGEGLTRLVEKMLGSENAPLKDEVLRRFLDYYSAHLSELSTLYPGVRETLERLDGVKKAVISNKRESLSRRLLEELGISDYFDIIVGSDTTPEKKPSPLPVRHVLESLGVEADEALMVGDSNYDVEAGKSAGVMTVALTSGYRDRSVLSEAGADRLIDGMSELLDVLYELDGHRDRRREKRHAVPEIYRDYVSLKIKIAEDFIPAALLDFSEHGLKFKAPVPFDAGSVRECAVSVPLSMTKEALFTVRIRHSEEDAGAFVCGAEVESVADEVWFRIFQRVLAFIAERAGTVF